MDNISIVNKRKVIMVAIICLFILIATTNKIYAKNKTITKDITIPTWITYGDTYRIKEESIKAAFKIKDSKTRVKFSTYSGSHLTVNSKGQVRVKKPDKNCRNSVNDYIKAEFTYKNTHYVLRDRYCVVFEYDDNNPPAKDITKDQIKRFKKAYETNNTKNLSKKEKRIFREVKKAVDYSNKGVNRYEKLWRLNDWIAKNIKCSQSQADYVHTLEGAMVKKEAVCEGITNAVKMCASIMGIPCEMVIGYIGTGTIMGHQWNIVKLEDGKWYHIDFTSNRTDNDKPFSYTTYNFFCLNDKQMKQLDFKWNDKKKATGSKYLLKNYQRDYFVEDHEGFYNTIKKAVQDKKEYVFFYEKDHTSYNLNNDLASEYVGQNIKIESIRKYGDIDIDVPAYRMPPEICATNYRHFMRLYKITYLKGKPEPYRYISNDNLNEFENILRSAVQRGETIIKNIAIAEGSYAEELPSDEIGYMLSGKKVMFSLSDGIGVPEFFKPDGKVYNCCNIIIDYSNADKKVYEVSNEDDVKNALDDAIANHEEQIYFFAPNYQDNLHWITSSYLYDINYIDNIHTYISPYGFVNPFTGEQRDNFMVEVTISYKG